MIKLFISIKNDLLRKPTYVPLEHKLLNPFDYKGLRTTEDTYGATQLCKVLKRLSNG